MAPAGSQSPLRTWPLFLVLTVAGVALIFIWAPETLHVAGIANATEITESAVETASTAADTSEIPERVRHRSALEDAVALPGLVLYLPIAAFFDLSKVVANAVWNQHLLERAKAWLTTADGRAGVRPLSSTQIGTGGHVFYRNLIGSGDASLTSSWGSTNRRKSTPAGVDESVPQRPGRSGWTGPGALQHPNCRRGTPERL